VVLVMPVAVVAVYLTRLVLEGTAWMRPAWLDAYGGTTPDSSPESGESAAPYDARRRIAPAIALVGLGLAAFFLGSAQYVEPYRGAGGQLLIALLTLFAASLVALNWCVRDQGRANSPEAAR
jgi:hypothetical protein